mmetsp:Transcript_21907/g.59982  ORF Transcript_21907/g.59982 Transcript_21907/m.59982 type:complete len:206 (-) Transcript_21907:338-955(-)
MKCATKSSMRANPVAICSFSSASSKLWACSRSRSAIAFSLASCHLPLTTFFCRSSSWSAVIVPPPCAGPGSASPRAARSSMASKARMTCFSSLHWERNSSWAVSAARLSSWIFSAFSARSCIHPWDSVTMRWMRRSASWNRRAYCVITCLNRRFSRRNSLMSARSPLLSLISVANREMLWSKLRISRSIFFRRSASEKVSALVSR